MPVAYLDPRKPHPVRMLGKRYVAWCAPAPRAGGALRSSRGTAALVCTRPLREAIAGGRSWKPLRASPLAVTPRHRRPRGTRRPTAAFSASLGRITRASSVRRARALSQRRAQPALAAAAPPSYTLAAPAAAPRLPIARTSRAAGLTARRPAAARGGSSTTCAPTGSAPCRTRASAKTGASREPSPAQPAVGRASKAPRPSEPRRRSFSKRRAARGARRAARKRARSGRRCGPLLARRAARPSRAAPTAPRPALAPRPFDRAAAPTTAGLLTAAAPAPRSLR